MDTTVIRNLLGSLLAAQALVVAVAGTAHASAGVSPPTVRYEHCSWNHPGINPFMGDVVAAVDRYQDILPEVRSRLKERMARREYDDLVSIRRDAITGRGGYEYGKDIEQMHFGTQQVCRTVTRAAWTPQMEERGLVYCEGETCIVVPTVCRNVSRLARRGVGNDVAQGLPPFLPPGAGYPVGDEGVPTALPLAEPLPIDDFAAPGAGFPVAAGPIGEAPAAGFGGVPVGLGLLAPIGAPALAFGGGGGGGSIPGGSTPGTSTSATPPPGGEGGDGTGAITPVPEPETWALLAGGLVALVFLQQRAARRRSARR